MPDSEHPTAPAAWILLPKDAPRVRIFGLTPEVALAVSLIKRVRDFVLGVPALATWQVMEGRRAWLGLGRKDDRPNP